MKLPLIDLWRHHAWRDWPIVEGTVDRSVPVPNDGRSDSWYCEVLYTFRFNGTTYNGETLIPCDDEEAAELLCSQWRTGQAVNVIYKPGDPSVNRTAIDDGF